jgi:RimJ/RimL family protein N-acetyltransferase
LIIGSVLSGDKCHHPGVRWHFENPFGWLALAYIWEEHFAVSEEVIVIRQAMVDDAEEIGKAHASAWEVAYAELFEPDVLRRAAARRRTMWRQILASSDFDVNGFLVAEQDGSVVGFSQFGQNAEETGRGEIFGFYLHPAAWGQGSATQLMAASLGDLDRRGLNPVVVWTHPGVMRAQAFYVKSGFTATGRSRTATLGDGIDTPVVEFAHR